jgi:lipoprotein signal peptidase
MSTVTPLPTALSDPIAQPIAAARAPARPVAARLRVLLGVVLAVTLVDQVAKAWAWRHLALVHINSGSGLLFGDQAGAIYRDDTLGAAIDGVATLAVAALGVLLLQRPRPTVPFVGAALILAGWASNLGDRLGLHSITAPGTERGVVDFLHWHGRLWNLADVTIIAGVALCVAGGLWLLGAGALRRLRRAVV